jgi:hypothetical protein
MEKFKAMVTNEMLLSNTPMGTAIAAIEAMHSEEATTNRWNALMRSRSEEMNATPRGRHFIAKYGDPLDEIRAKCMENKVRWNGKKA